MPKNSSLEVTEFDLARPLKNSQRHARDLRKVFQLMDMGLGTSPGEYPREKLDEERENSLGFKVFVIREAGVTSRILGCAGVSEMGPYSEQNRSLYLAVDEQERHKGLGRRLLARAAEFAVGGNPEATFVGYASYQDVPHLSRLGATFSPGEDPDQSVTYHLAAKEALANI